MMAPFDFELYEIGRGFFVLRPARGEFRSYRRGRAFPETASVDAELRVMRHALDRHDLLVAVGQAGKKSMTSASVAMPWGVMRIYIVARQWE